MQKATKKQVDIKQHGETMRKRRLVAKSKLDKLNRVKVAKGIVHPSYSQDLLMMANLTTEL